ncbi:MAG TPA: hypothetical protein VGG63_01125 [Steroidobacteraceae bacterium]|jgi:hypothetical protein
MSAAATGQISAFERLRDLPALFRGGDLTQRFGWTSKSASQYLYLWKRRGLVQALGGHSDVYANLLASRHPDWARALIMAMPSAVLIGIEALRRAGWTTQVTRRPTVAVKAGHALFRTDHFATVVRAPRWFEQIAPGIVGNSRESLRALRPAWALADQLADAGWGGGGLSPDDIEWSEISRADERDWRAASGALGLPRSALRAMAESPRAHQPRAARR